MQAIERLLCFGDNEHGRCQVPAEPEPVGVVAAGVYHTRAFKADGHLLRSGHDAHGQCKAPEDLGPLVPWDAGRYMWKSTKAD